MPSKAMKTMKVNPKSKARPKAKAAALGAAADIENFIAGSAKKSDDENEESEYSESEEESESGTEEPPVKKRPGANVAMKKPGAAPGNTTDRLKKHQWGKMVRDGAISSEVDNIVGGCTPSQRRDVINSSIVRHQDGKYTLQLKNPALELLIARWREKRSGWETIGVCKQVAQTKCGGPEGLRDAIRENNVKVQEVDGTETYHFKTFIESAVNVSTDGHRVKADSQKLDKRAWEALKVGLRDVGFLPEGFERTKTKSRSASEDKDLLANSLKIMEEKEVLMTKVYKDFHPVVAFNVPTRY